ncbi:MAG: hypothetical protein IPG00_09440 [Saprospiraceae bacterium]|nr:hypothetical protein [Saprospiraceae bacterium]
MATQGKVKELTGELMKNLSTLTKPRIDLIGLFILAIVQVISKPRQDILGDGYEK